MELVASMIALYVAVKVGWPVIKFIGLIVALGMILQSCGAHAQVATSVVPERYQPCAHFSDQDAYARCCWERRPHGPGAIQPERIMLGRPMQIKGDK